MSTAHSPSSASPLASVEMAPRDPILGITEAFNAASGRDDLQAAPPFDPKTAVPLRRVPAFTANDSRVRHARSYRLMI